MPTSYHDVEPINVGGSGLRRTSATHIIRYYRLAILLAIFTTSVYTVQWSFLNQDNSNRELGLSEIMPNFQDGYLFGVSLATIVVTVAG